MPWGGKSNVSTPAWVMGRTSVRTYVRRVGPVVGEVKVLGEKGGARTEYSTSTSSRSSCISSSCATRPSMYRSDILWYSSSEIAAASALAARRGRPVVKVRRRVRGWGRRCTLGSLQCGCVVGKDDGRGGVMGSLEDVGALGWEREREREGRMRRGAFEREREREMEMALWAMVDLFFGSGGRRGVEGRLLWRRYLLCWWMPSL